MYYLTTFTMLKLRSLIYLLIPFLLLARTGHGMPDCAAGVDEYNQPVTTQPYTGCWTSGEGQFVQSKNSTDNNYGECIYDIYAVNAGLGFGSWASIGGSSDCTGSSPGCTETITNDTQVCYSTSNALSLYELPSITIDAITIGGFGTVSTFTVTNETCVSESVAKSCTWDDTYAVCHEICVRTQILRVNGYKQLRCNGGTTADNQTNSGDAIICMQDFSIDAPVQDSLGTSCGGSCALDDPCSGLDVTELFPPVENFTSCQTVGSPRFKMLNDTGSMPAPISSHASRLLARSGYMSHPMLMGLIVLASLVADI